MGKIKNIAIITLFILCVILFFTRGCGTVKENNGEIIHDTIIIHKHSIDTVWTTKVVNKYISVFKQPIIDTIIIDNSQHIISTYNDSLVDTNLVIRYKDRIEGKFISKSIGYTLKHPIITIHDSIIVKITTTIKDSLVKLPKFTIFAGGIVGGNKNQLATIEPIIGFTSNKNAIFYGYNFMNQTHNIGFYHTIFKSKK